MTQLRIPVEIGGVAHEYLFGDGVLDGLGTRLASRGKRGVVALVVDAGLAHGPLCARTRTALAAGGLRASVIVAPPGEEAKSVAGAETLWTAFAEAGLERGGVVVALGGGAVGDAAGFAASTFLRGVDLVQAPTTLLAMADSAVGGKTALNLPCAKNQVGTFHFPLEVAADAAALDTLPAREISSGMAEVLKCALLSDPGALARFADAAPLVLGRDRALLCEALSLAVTTKARLAGHDARDLSGERALLNLGHTVAHALETATGHATWRHGEAVSVGLCAAARLAHVRGLLDARDLRDLERALSAFELPTELPAGVDAQQIVRLSAFDKKRVLGRRRMVLPLHGAGAALYDVDDAELLNALM